ncbi:hypothetical protein DVH24_002757 [Malus domestica]|uniref:Uncharacterized protein n=1 Tax=Malus domestica TaxID=3750 RepID=A0A498K3B1_MALDO|nr:hypothetical protein DVH24_002757 [Malus domestica]
MASTSQRTLILLITLLALSLFAISATASRPCKTFFFSSYSFSLRHLPPPLPPPTSSPSSPKSASSTPSTSTMPIQNTSLSHTTTTTTTTARSDFKRHRSFPSSEWLLRRRPTTSTPCAIAPRTS